MDPSMQKSQECPLRPLRLPPGSPRTKAYSGRRSLDVEGLGTKKLRLNSVPVAGAGHQAADRDGEQGNDDGGDEE